MGIFGKPPETKPGDAPSLSHPVASPQPAPTPSRAPVCVIGPKTTLKGELLGDEDVLVEGSVEGQIRISRDLRVGTTGSVRANVEAQSVVVAGEVGVWVAVTVGVESGGALPIPPATTSA